MKSPSAAVSLIVVATLLAPPAALAGETGTPASSSPGDCGLLSSPDRDGLAARLELARTTEMLVPSHRGADPSGREALGGPVSGGGGLPGVQSRLPRVNYIDDEILGAMTAAGVKPAPLSSDAEFLRRVSLDLTGRLPDLATTQAFLADKTAGKRDRLIDTLLASDAFVDRWTFFYEELFRLTGFADSGRLFTLGRNAYHAYFQDALRSRKPYDLMAREILSGAGDTSKMATATANHSVRNLQTNGPQQDTYDNQAADASRIFLGTNVFCSSCHNGAGHTDAINLYLSTVDRQRFWEQAAFFSRTLIRRQGADPGTYYYLVSDLPAGNYQLNTTTGNKTTRDASWTDDGKTTTITPKYLSTGEVPQSGETYRVAYARLLTKDPQFARASANYIWKEMFGAGIVEPANDWDLLRQDPSSPPPGTWTIQPTHPNLIVRLGQDFAGSGFDLRTLLKTIARSSSYQLSSSYPYEWSESYAPYFARHFVRKLPGEMVFDAITRATGVSYQIPVQGANAVTWAMQLPDTAEPQTRGGGGGAGAQAAGLIRSFLDGFLRGDRDADARSPQFSITQALLLMNDKVSVTDRVRATTNGSLVKQLVDKKASPTETVNTLYLATLCRYPDATELAAGTSMLTSLQPGQTTAQATEDLAYALLNKLDFFLNY